MKMHDSKKYITLLYPIFIDADTTDILCSTTVKFS